MLSAAITQLFNCAVQLVSLLGNLPAMLSFHTQYKALLVFLKSIIRKLVG